MKHPAIVVIVAGVVAAGLGWNLGRPQSLAVAPATSAPKPSVASSAPDADYQEAAAPDYDARRSRPLREILDAIDAARLDPVTQTAFKSRVSSTLFALLESLAPEEITEVLDHLTALPPPPPDQLFATVLGRWAQHDGAAAMNWAARLSPARQDVVRGAILAGWTHHDPKGAWAWYQAAWDAAPEPRSKLEQDFSLLIHGWAKRDAPAAFAATLHAGTHGTYDKWSGFTSLIALPDRRDQVLDLIAGIADEKQRAAAHHSALSSWSQSAPTDAAAWLDSHLPDADPNLVWSVAERFGRANPRANADWLLQRTPPDQRDEAYRLSLYQWAEHSPNEAAAWLESAGPTDMSAELMATRFARADVDTAMTWARRVGPENRPNAIVQTLAQALVAGQKPDPARYAAEAGLGIEEFSQKIEAARQQINSRL